MTAVFRQLTLEAALTRLFPPGVAVAAVAVGAVSPALMPEEEAAIVRAMPARAAEFAAGRSAARRAMAVLGYPATPIPTGQDRAPVWPLGLAGSISHAQGMAVAAVRLGKPLGLDIEEDAGLEPDLWPLICTAEELEVLPTLDRDCAVRLVFSAKEAVYKAQYLLTGKLIGYDAVTVALQDGGFVARFCQDVGPLQQGHEVRGRVARVAGLILTGVAL